MIESIGTAIPAQVARFMTADRFKIVFGATYKAVQTVQHKYAYLSVPEKKAKACEIIKDDFDMNQHLFGQAKLVDEYLERSLIPSAVEGVVLALNLSLWFDTSKEISVGGKHNPGPVPAISKIPGPPPPAPTKV